MGLAPCEEDAERSEGGFANEKRVLAASESLQVHSAHAIVRWKIRRHEFRHWAAVVGSVFRIF